MQKFSIDDFQDQKGWFVGNFNGAKLKEDFEVAIKKYKALEINPMHYHKLSKEINIIVSGVAIFKLSKGEVMARANDVIIIEENEASEFVPIEDTLLVVIKNKSVEWDKYEGKP